MKKRKTQKKRRFGYKFWFMSFIVVYVLYAFIQQQFALNNYNREISSLKSDIEEMENELTKLNDLESVYKSDEFIERVARERLGFVRSDETLFVDITGK